MCVWFFCRMYNFICKCLLLGVRVNVFQMINFLHSLVYTTAKTSLKFEF